MTLPPRTAAVRRTTRETDIDLRLDLDGTGVSRVDTGIPFLDHMLDALARHARLDLDLSCKGDLQVDDHHTVEDCALVLGQALDEALGERRGIGRFGDALVPLDEALARVAIDLSGRPFAMVAAGFRGESLGTMRTENLEHFMRSFATAGRLCLHVRLLEGDNDHHRAEAMFKGVAVALRGAIARDGEAMVPSTKGSL